MYKYLYLICIFTFLQHSTTFNSQGEPLLDTATLRRIFSQENLAGFNSSQDPDELETCYSKRGNYTVTTQKVQNELAAAAISYSSALGEIWIKALALRSDLTSEAQNKAIMSILRQIRPQRRTPMKCNIEVSEDNANKTLRATLANAGWQQTEEYITLTKQIAPDTIDPEPTKYITLPDFSIDALIPENLEPTLQLFQNPAIFPWLNSTQADLAAYLQNPKYRTYTARSTKQIIGALVFKLTNKGCRIELLAVHPDFQKKKVASCMLNHITHKDKFSTIDITALSRNTAAIECYLRNGFRPIRTLRAMKKLPTPGISPSLTPMPEKRDDDPSTLQLPPAIISPTTTTPTTKISPTHPTAQAPSDMRRCHTS